MDSLKHMSRIFLDLSGERRKTSMHSSFHTGDLEDYAKFKRLFNQTRFLGEGSDGTVYAYQHKHSKALIAVKTPIAYNTPYLVAEAAKFIKAEVENLTILGQHEHIAGMLAWSHNHHPAAPAIFLPFCELGDLRSYMAVYKDQQLQQSKHVIRTSEVTIWKCLRDMALALDHLHNMNDEFGYVHNDIKPDNILVEFPKGWDPKDGIPDEPVFRLTDFARMTRYPLLEGEKPKKDCLGTPEYAPPLAEQEKHRPSVDIWALGATLQTLALRINPVQSREAFLESQLKAHKLAPILSDDGAWKQLKWRVLRPTVYRPLDATQEELVNHHDVPMSIWADGFPEYRAWKHWPYTRTLNTWYKSLWERDEEKRTTAKQLVEWCVPLVARYIRVARHTEKAEERFEKAAKSRDEVEGKQQNRELRAEAMELLDPPSYEGNGYGDL